MRSKFLTAYDNRYSINIEVAICDLDTNKNKRRKNMETKNEIMIVDEKSLKDKIYVIRGQQVMLDFELAEIYGYETKQFNRQVQRNIDKFENDFMFELTQIEWDSMRCQNVTASRRNDRYLPYAFTEQGIYMLMTVLRGDIAIKQSKALIRLFKSMKDYIVSKTKYPPIDQFNQIVIKTYENSDAIEDIRRQMVTHNQLNTFIKIFDDNKQEELLILDGEPFKADVAYQKIFKKAKSKIYIIDDYVGIKTLEHLRSIKAKITIFTDNKNKHLTHKELIDFKNEYPLVSISFIRTNKIVHDRFIVIDYNSKSERTYHLGSSIKDSGNKITMINEFSDNKLIHPIIKELLKNKENDI